MSLLSAAAELRQACDALEVPRAAYAYNPLAYAWDAHRTFTQRYGDSGPPGRVLLVGMNPGPWGMGQTGVPFGDVVFVRDWMGITGAHTTPARVHPKRPVTGFATTRREPSGSRLYGWARDRWGTAADFFARFYVVNYCPLLFFDADGKNLTPPQLGARGVEAIEAVCDPHLAAVIATTRPKLVVGVGQFAEDQARAVIDAHKLGTPTGRVLHPSPASPEANKGWAEKAEAQLRALGVSIPS